MSARLGQGRRYFPTLVAAHPPGQPPPMDRDASGGGPTCVRHVALGLAAGHGPTLAKQGRRGQPPASAMSQLAWRVGRHRQAQGHLHVGWQQASTRKGPCSWCRVQAMQLAQADFFASILAAVRIGGIVACKSQTDVACVPLWSRNVGDVLRRLVAPWSRLSLHSLRAAGLYRLSERVGSEALPHVFPRLPKSIFVPLYSLLMPLRHFTMFALWARPELRPLLPFARQIYGFLSSYACTDGRRIKHHIAQGERGSRGIP